MAKAFDKVKEFGGMRMEFAHRLVCLYLAATFAQCMAQGLELGPGKAGRELEGGIAADAIQGSLDAGQAGRDLGSKAGAAAELAFKVEQGSAQGIEDGQAAEPLAVAAQVPVLDAVQSPGRAEASGPAQHGKGEVDGNLVAFCVVHALLLIMVGGLIIAQAVTVFYLMRMRHEMNRGAVMLDCNITCLRNKLAVAEIQAMASQSPVGSGAGAETKAKRALDVLDGRVA